MKVIRNLPCFLVSLGTALALAGSVAAQDRDGAHSIVDPRIVDPSGIVDPGAFDGSTSPRKHFGVVDSVDGLLGQASRSLEMSRSAESGDVSDPAFDVYANPRLIGKAYGANDSAMLTDVALQLAEGERVLLRSRNAISAKQALALAIQAASQRQDTGSLQRIAKFAELSGNKELAGQVAAALKLAAVSRDTTSKMIMVHVEEVEVEDYARIRHYNDQIEHSRLLGDTRRLDALEQDLDGCIPDPFRAAFRKRIGEAKSEIPDGHVLDDQLLGTLGKLEAMSRDDDDENTKADEPVEVSGSH